MASTYVWQFCCECRARLTHPASLPTHCDRCAARRAPQVARARARAAMLVAAYNDGFEGRPKAKASGLYADAYRLGARRRANGRPAATFTLFGATSSDVVAA